MQLGLASRVLASTVNSPRQTAALKAMHVCSYVKYTCLFLCIRIRIRLQASAGVQGKPPDEVDNDIYAIWACISTYSSLKFYVPLLLAF